MAPERRVALVTGAGRGLGAAIAPALAAAGYAVAANDLTTPDGRYAADVTDEADVLALVAEVEQTLGGVDVLVVNATGPQPAVPLNDLTWTDHLDQLRYFVKSPTLLVRAVLPGMRERGFGRIVQIGSDLPERALPGMSAYAAAKAAQWSLTRTWANELAGTGVTVNLVAPGWIPVERHADVPPDELADYVAATPAGRVGVPDDIAAAVVYLASDAAGFVNGARLPVNGGHTLG